MRRVSWRSILAHLKDAIYCAILYAAVLGGGVFLLLVVSSAIGYLPYSDRPGPGWFSPHLPTLQELRFFGSWAFFFVGPFALFWGAVLFLFVRLTGWLGAPKWLLRVLGGFFAGALGLLGIAAAGWYIALSAAAVYGGAILGVIFGAILLPRFAILRLEPQRAWWQWAAIAGSAVLLAGGIVYPLLPNLDAQSLEVRIMRLVPGPEKITVESSGLKQTEVTVLNSLGLHGKLHGGLQSISGGGDKKARVLIVVRAPISSKITFREPKATNVVYVQDGDRWNMYPRDAPTLRKSITLTPEPGEYEGLSMAEESGNPRAFTWYPPIMGERR